MYTQNDHGTVHRPIIYLNNLDLSKYRAEDFLNGRYFYRGISIPLKFNVSEQKDWKPIWDQFVSNYVMNNGMDDVVPCQPIHFEIYLEDDIKTGKRSYTLAVFIQTKFDDEPDCITKDIELQPQEKEAINMAFLKLVDPNKYFLQYTRCQVANSNEVAGLGFVMDEIDDNDMYKSVWLSQDRKTCVIGCIPNVHQSNSKLQILRVG